MRETRALNLAELKASLGSGNPSGEVGVFVHGYNTSYPEAVFRMAQLAKDVKFPGKLVEIGRAHV